MAQMHPQHVQPLNTASVPSRFSIQIYHRMRILFLVCALAAIFVVLKGKVSTHTATRGLTNSRARANNLLVLNSYWKEIQNSADDFTIPPQIHKDASNDVLNAC